MIDYELFRFASAPRTASTWVRKAVAMTGLQDRGRNDVHLPHLKDASVVRLSCVRHPCAWLASYYSSIYPGRIGIDRVDSFADCQVGSFDAYVRWYLSNRPGSVGKMFRSYGADVLIRAEDLPWSFVSFMESIGVPSKLRERCLVLGPQNGTRHLPRWSPSLRDRVMQAESEMVELFEYH